MPDPSHLLPHGGHIELHRSSFPVKIRHHLSRTSWRGKRTHERGRLGNAVDDVSEAEIRIIEWYFAKLEILYEIVAGAVPAALVARL
ncbi:uncharacterized protein SPSK_06799 [Sporothrix schenckii 1099-18]|uniref:Uncharacterized protein n=1 Tax=Sporothrix schenckii 1099-18 TaxID=1397361 RepID=A0A0F2MLY3_SPOSC|nr:uncharacterized protein SPSK_06799 [Sporothrix schenckii 1099-18]KJR90044.1 hypothetical protein SPSK_06799 [Sporothrix schenckii 1099-18]